MDSATQVRDIGRQACDQEPIRIPGSIQPHGALITVDPQSFEVLQASRNVAGFLGCSAEQMVGKPLVDALPEPWGEKLGADLKRVRLSESPEFLQTIDLDRKRTLLASAHLNDRVVIIEFEELTNREENFVRELYPHVSGFVSSLQGMRNRDEVADTAAEQIRAITNFDRVLVYEFDRDWNGTVIAESRNDKLPSYIDLRFPASDIPRQARDLYRLNPIRLIPDVSYEPSPMFPESNPRTGQLLDMGYAALRSVSPVHRQYMKNMGTASSMSISLLRDGELWGLISCHHHEPKRVPFDVRKACEFLGQVVSAQMEAHERSFEYQERVRLKTIEGRLLTRMAQHENFVEGLVDAETPLLEFGRAEGAAILQSGECALIGHTPSEEQARELVNWISDNAREQDIFFTDNLASLMPTAKQFVDRASGVLAVRISKLHRSYVLWFRPEVIQTVRWGGDPNTAKELQGVRLHPRQSFELWKEVVREKAIPWRKTEIEAAVDLRNAIVGIVLRKAEEMAELTAQLERSNRELEAFSYSVSHDLRAPFRHIVGYAELLREREAGQLSDEGQRYVQTITESAQFAGMLVDNLLNFSRIARTSMTRMLLDMNDLVREVQREVQSEARGRLVEWKVEELPRVIADPVLLRLAVRNLFSNALKYTRVRENAVVEVTSRAQDGEIVFCVKDNGIGFDMRYVNKLFGVFQRLHRMEDFEGTGIGLANVRRIVERHGGRTWAEGEPGKGAAFYFVLPAELTAEKERAETDLAS